MNNKEKKQIKRKGFNPLDILYGALLGIGGGYLVNKIFDYAQFLDKQDPTLIYLPEVMGVAFGALIATSYYLIRYDNISSKKRRNKELSDKVDEEKMRKWEKKTTK